MEEPELTHPIRVSFQPDRAAYMRLILTVSVRRSRRVFILVGLIPLLAFAYTLAMNPNAMRQAEGWKLPIMLVWPVLAFVFIPLGMWRAARRQWDTNLALQEPREYEFSEHGIRSKSGVLGHAEFSWALVQKATVAAGMLVLWVGSAQVHYIPLSELAPEQRTALDELLRRKVAGFHGLPF